MDCKVIVSSISEFIDGGLAVKETRVVEEHLTQCASCRTIKQDLDGVRRAAQALPLHTPSPTLWIRIQAELEAELGAGQKLEASGKEGRLAATANSSWWRQLLGRRVTLTVPQLAGASFLAAAVLISSGYLLRESSLDTPTLRDGVATILVPDLEEALRAELNGFNQRKANWDPTVRADFEQHLQQIDQSIEGCRVSLNRNPSDQTQREMVRALVDEKIRLLKDSSRLKW